MSHPQQLMERLIELVRGDYQAGEFQFVKERAIKGTRLMPDLQIRDGNGHLVCVVEVGYTRPEKLTAYSKIVGLKDIRWYDKELRLHTPMERRSVLVSTEIIPAGELYLYWVSDQVDCLDEECLGVNDDNDDLEYAPVDVETLVVTDEQKIFFPSYCDKCGRTWFADEESDAASLFYSIEPLIEDSRRRGRELGASIRLGWHETVAYVKEHMGLLLEYSSGAAVREHEPFGFRADLKKLVDEAHA